MLHQVCDVFFFSPDMTFVNKVPEDSIEHRTNSFQCPACSACFSTAAILRKHELVKHMKLTEPIFLVDEERGIFVTAQDKSGPRTIIHMCKSFTRQVLDCEGCREFMAVATDIECRHLERLKHFKPQAPPPLLHTTSGVSNVRPAGRTALIRPTR